MVDEAKKKLLSDKLDGHGRVLIIGGTRVRSTVDPDMCGTIVGVAEHQEFDDGMPMVQVRTADGMMFGSHPEDLEVEEES